MTDRTAYDVDLQERLITGFATVVDLAGGITSKSGPQIRESLLLAFCQVAVQEGFGERDAEHLLTHTLQRLAELFPAMIERNTALAHIMQTGRIGQ